MYTARESYATSVEVCQKGASQVRIDTRTPDRFKSLYVDDGQGAWERTTEGVRAIGSDEISDMRHYTYVDWVSVLWTLRQPGYRFTSLGRQDVRGATTIGVKVSRDGELDVELYVDTTSALVVKHGLHHKSVDGEAVYDETFYSEWRMANGVRYPSHAEKLRNGKLRSVWDFEERFPDELDPALFQRPPL
jgi:hypothetical protein